MERKRIAIVVQRYGPEVLGGSESLARSLAHMLSDVYDIDVLTTCAKDYVTWKNEFPAGESMDGPVKVIRFEVDRLRSKWFNLYNALMLRVPHTKWMEELWMRMQGPYASNLIRYIQLYASSYDLFFFITYMYGTTYYGIKEAYDRSVLVPTAHDEPFIRFQIYREMYDRTRNIIYLTEEERKFVDGLFNVDIRRGTVIGVPVGECSGDPEQFRRKFGIDSNFILYVGRIDTMKGVDRLIGYCENYRREYDSAIKLVLCGDGPMRLEPTDSLIPLGFVSDEDKFGAMKAAIATIQPSKYESYSIVTIESMMCGTPIIANGDCEVLKGHCLRGDGGLCYSSYAEFAKALNLLVADTAARDQIGESGRVYAKSYYSTAAIRKRYISTIDGLIK